MKITNHRPPVCTLLDRERTSSEQLNLFRLALEYSSTLFGTDHLENCVWVDVVNIAQGCMIQVATNDLITWLELH